MFLEKKVYCDIESCFLRQKTDLVSPHQYHAQQRSQENGPDEETGRNKMGSQHENFDPGLHCNCQTPQPLRWPSG